MQRIIKCKKEDKYDLRHAIQGEGDERLGEGVGREEVFEIEMEAFFILNVIKT